jgi:hypothetical protein
MEAVIVNPLWRLPGQEFESGLSEHHQLVNPTLAWRDRPDAIRFGIIE